MSATVSGWMGLASGVVDGVLAEPPASTGLVREPAEWTVPQSGTLVLLGGVTFGPLVAAAPTLTMAGFFTNQADALPAEVIDLAPILPLLGGYVSLAPATLSASTPTPGLDVLTFGGVPITFGGQPIQLG